MEIAQDTKVYVVDVINASSPIHIDPDITDRILEVYFMASDYEAAQRQGQDALDRFLRTVKNMYEDNTNLSLVTDISLAKDVVKSVSGLERFLKNQGVEEEYRFCANYEQKKMENYVKCLDAFIQK